VIDHNINFNRLRHSTALTPVASVRRTVCPKGVLAHGASERIEVSVQYFHI